MRGAALGLVTWCAAAGAGCAAAPVGPAAQAPASAPAGAASTLASPAAAPDGGSREAAGLALAPALPPPADAAASMPSPADPVASLPLPSSLPSPAAPPEGAPSAPPLARVLLVDEPPFSPVYAHRALAAGPPAPSRSRRRGRRGRPYHGAPRVVVDADQLPEDAELQRAARDRGYWPFRVCFEEGLRRLPDLGGTVTLRLQLSPSGAGTAEVAATTLRDEVVAACLAREATSLRLPPGSDEPRVTVLRITLGAGDDPVFVPPAVRNAQALQQALRAPWTAVEQCFSDGLSKDPGAGGRMELRFRVHPSGAVVEVAEGDTRFRDIDVTRFVLGVYRAASLPPLDRPGREAAARDSSFVYALHFEAAAAPRP
jgi:hypothetical protein